MDELTLPTVSWVPNNSDGAQEWDASFSWTKTITPTSRCRSAPERRGSTRAATAGTRWRPRLKYQALCIPRPEFMFTVGFERRLGRNARQVRQVGGQNTYSPVLDVGLGFGTLPQALNYLRPFAVTGEFSTSTPGQALRGDEMFPTTFNWGFTLQYSLPYFNTQSARSTTTSSSI